MPKKKDDLELTESKAVAVVEPVRDEDKPRSLEFFKVTKCLSNTMYYRLQYEIRPFASTKKTMNEWEKLLEQVQS